jgi:hypothetical protein
MPREGGASSIQWTYDVVYTRQNYTVGGYWIARLRGR